MNTTVEVKTKKLVVSSEVDGYSYREYEVSSMEAAEYFMTFDLPEDWMTTATRDEGEVKYERVEDMSSDDYCVIVTTRYGIEVTYYMGRDCSIEFYRIA